MLFSYASLRCPPPRSDSATFRQCNCVVHCNSQTCFLLLCDSAVSTAASDFSFVIPDPRDSTSKNVFRGAHGLPSVLPSNKVTRRLPSMPSNKSLKAKKKTSRTGRYSKNSLPWHIVQRGSNTTIAFRLVSARILTACLAGCLPAGQPRTFARPGRARIAIAMPTGAKSLGAIMQLRRQSAPLW